jgi:endonuclease/exonuclease/phosphatase family metal-dependent hydrolase
MPWLLAGDFNALPPGDDPGRLGADAGMYGTPSPLAPLYGTAESAVPLEGHRREPERWRTWVPFRSTVPQRTLDHAFASSGSCFSRTSVDRRALDLSDHLPLVFHWHPRPG